MSTYDARKVSVCLLNYNHGQLIDSTVESILAQDCDGFEFIISDDCSTDDSWERILALSECSRRIIPVRTPKNLRMPGNANFAVGQSTRPFIALLHHDDLYATNMLRRWAQCLDDNPSIGFVFNSYGVHGCDRIDDHPFSEGVQNGGWFLRNHLLRRWNCPVRGTAMVRRSSWNSVGGMNVRFDLLADVDLWMRLAQTYDVGYVKEPLILVRHQRPRDYPDEYCRPRGFWRRKRLLYEIHASNRGSNGIGRNSIAWFCFRIRLSLESTKWIIYALVRRRYEMIASSDLGRVPEEYFFVSWLRAFARWLTSSRPSSLNAR